MRVFHCAILSLSLVVLMSLGRSTAAKDGLDLGGGWFMEFGSEYSPDDKTKMLRCVDPVYQTFLRERGNEVARTSSANMPMPLRQDYINQFIKQWRDTYMMPAWQRCNRQLFH